MKRVVGGVTTVYVYDATGKLAQEYGGVASGVTGRSYLFADHLGSTRMQVAGDGTVQGWWDYAPFGEEVPGTAGNRSGVSGFAYGGSTVSVMFTGQMRDRLADGTATDLDFFGARYLSSAQGGYQSWGGCTRFSSLIPVIGGACVSFSGGVHSLRESPLAFRGERRENAINILQLYFLQTFGEAAYQQAKQKTDPEADRKPTHRNCLIDRSTGECVQ